MTPGAISALSLDELVVGVALLLLVSIIASKASARIGVPALILFLTVGMLAGSDGIGGIAFDNAKIAQWLGVVALSFILFSGGLETQWSFVRRSVWRAGSLATVGVAVTTAIVAWFAHAVLGFTLAEGFLLGAIVSPTDAAAVFSVLRGRGVQLNEGVVSTLELESGSNDPMAVFLTAAGVQLLVRAHVPMTELVVEFLREMTFGAAAGLAAGFAAVALINALRLEADGLYPVLTVAIVLFTYGATDLIGGNGFLAVYLAGIVMGNRNFIQRRSLTRFHDGLAWLMQIAMFLSLGLLVFPSQLPPLAGVSLALAAVLTFIARPLAVFLSLAASKLHMREKALISWVGLRGAVPIILATFPMLAGVPKSGLIFNIVFFVVVASVAVQGTTTPLVARWLRLDSTTVPDPSPAVATLPDRAESSLVTLEVSPHSPAAGHRVVELRDWPREALILVLYRGNEFFVPNGSTLLTAGDRLIVLTSRTTLDAVRRVTEQAV